MSVALLQHTYWLLSLEIVRDEKEAMTLYSPIRSCQRSASDPWGEEVASIDILVSEYCRADSMVGPIFSLRTVLGTMPFYSIV